MEAAGGGVDVIDHGVSDGEATAELIDLIRRNGVTYAPTHAVYHPKGRDILDEMLAAVVPPDSQAAVKPPLTPPTPDTKLVGAYRDPGSYRAQRWRHLTANTARIRAAGVQFGLGTDAGVTNTWHGWSSLRELQLLVYGGLTPLEALTAATGASANALNVEQERGTIKAGKLADLVLIDGRPHEEIADVLRIERVFRGGSEIDREALAAFIAEPGISHLPTRSVPPLLDDFELAGRRSSIGTNWVNRTDPGLEHASSEFTRVWRKRGNRALAVQAQMSMEDWSWASVELPLTAGAVVPADLSAFHGIEFDVRGEGDYLMEIDRGKDRDYRDASGRPHAPFSGQAAWRTVRIRFADLEASVPGLEDAHLLRFRMTGKPGETRWLELDNLRLFR